MTILDANALLRYVLNDNAEQAEKVSAVVRNGSVTTLEVIAEVVYVLSGVYGMPRHEVTWVIHCIMLDVRVEEAKVVRYALGVFDQTSLDFVDCILVAYNKVLGLEVMSFDKKLNRSLGMDFEIYQ